MVKKIAVLRANALEDFVCVLPALQALREKFKDAEIVYFGKKWHQEYLRDRLTPIDRVIVVPPYCGVGESEDFSSDDSTINAFFEEMQKEQFDIALQMQDEGKFTNAFLLRLGAKSTIGIKTDDAAPLDISIPYVYYLNDTMRYLELVSHLGTKTRFIEPQLGVTKNDLAEANAVLQNSEDKPIALLHAGGSDVKKRWPPDRFSRVAEFLIDKGFRVCTIGFEEEGKIAEAVIANVETNYNVQNVTGKLTFAGITGLTSLASIVISNDTALLHLARALQIPTVGIFWCGNIMNALPTTTALHRNLLSWEVDCPLCRLSTFKFNETISTCNHNASFVAEIGVDEVEDAIKELIEFDKEDNNDMQLLISA